MSATIPLTKVKVSEINPFPSLFTIKPNDHDHEVGLRFGICMMVPIAVVWAMGRMDLALFTTYSAFIAVYGKNMAHKVRFPMQALAGVLMFAVMMAAMWFATWVYDPAVEEKMHEIGSHEGVLGVPSLPLSVMVVLATAVVAFFSSLAAGYMQLRPTGCMFHIFAFASIVATPKMPPVEDAALASIYTMLFALVIGVSSRFFSRKARRSPLIARVERKPLPPHRVLFYESLWFFIAAAIAGLIATQIAQPLGLQRPHWAMVSAVVPLMGHSTRFRINRGFQRIIGTFAGTFLIAALVYFVHDHWAMIFIIGLSQMVAESFMARNYAIGQMFVAPVAMMSFILASDAFGVELHEGAFIFERIVETILGSLVGCICVVWPYAWRKWVRKLPDPAVYTPRSVKQYQHWRSLQTQHRIEVFNAGESFLEEDSHIARTTRFAIDGFGLEHAYMWGGTKNAKNSSENISWLDKKDDSITWIGKKRRRK